MKRASLAAPLPAVALLAAGCAGAPLTDGMQEIEVRATTWAPYDGPGESFKVLREVEGVRCTLRNDRGAWTVSTPGVARIARSSVPLEIDCAKDGYVDRRERLACLSPAQWLSTHEKVEIALAFVTLPLAVAAAPVAPGLALQAASQGALMGGGVAASHVARGSPSCYGNAVAVLLERDVDGKEDALERSSGPS